MTKLIRANLARMFRSISFWGIVAAQLLFTVLVIYVGNAFELGEVRIMGVLQEKQALEYRMACAFLCFPFFQAVFVSLFLSAEKREGTLRNKLVVGYTKRQIYLSNLISCLVGTAVLYGAWFLGGLIEMPRLKPWRLEPEEVLLFLLLYVLSAAAGTAIYVMFAHVCVYGSSVLLITLLFTGMFLLEGWFNYLVTQVPEMKWTVRPASFYEEEVWKQVPGEMVSNPSAVHGIRRKVYLAVESLIPSGQHIHMMDRTKDKQCEIYYQTDEGWYRETPYGRHPYVEITVPGMLGGSIIMILVFTALGMAVFCRENLK